MDLYLFLSILSAGLCMGGVYALLAIPFNFQLGQLKVTNFAYGNLLMVAMYVVFICHNNEIPYWGTFSILLPVYFVLGWFLRRYIVFTNNENVQILLTMGIAILIENLVQVVWGSFPRSLGGIEEGLLLGDVYISLTRLKLLCVSLVILGIGYVFLQKSWYGRCIRALVQQPAMAAVMGINTRGTACVAFAASFCYLAINRHLNNLTPQQIAKLLMLVQTSGILEELSIRRGVITPSHEMLPGWPIPQFTSDENPPLPAHLILTYQPPMELESVAEQLKTVLATHGCTLEIRASRNKQWKDTHQIEEADLLLADHLVGESPEAAMESWLQLDPLWRGILSPEQLEQQQETLIQIQQTELAAERFRQLREYYNDLMLTGLILPLFNYQYQVNAPPRIKGVTLTAYGWFDFNQAWLPPETN